MKRSELISRKKPALHSSSRWLAGVLLIFIAISFALGLRAQMPANGADETVKFKTTMASMKSIAMAIEAYLIDWAFVPKVGKFKDLNAPFLIPFYIKRLPLKDAWGNDFIYVHDNLDGYSLASPGRDGKFMGFQQSGRYADLGDRDIIFANGRFTYAPEKINVDPSIVIPY